MNIKVNVHQPRGDDPLMNVDVHHLSPGTQPQQAPDTIWLKHLDDLACIWEDCASWHYGTIARQAMKQRFRQIATDQLIALFNALNKAVVIGAAESIERSLIAGIRNQQADHGTTIRWCRSLVSFDRHTTLPAWTIWRIPDRTGQQISPIQILVGQTPKHMRCEPNTISNTNPEGINRSYWDEIISEVCREGTHMAHGISGATDLGEQAGKELARTMRHVASTQVKLGIAAASLEWIESPTQRAMAISEAVRDMSGLPVRIEIIQNNGRIIGMQQQRSNRIDINALEA